MAANEHEALTPAAEEKRLQNRSRGDRFIRVFYTKEDKKFCGRTWRGWVTFWTFYIITHAVFSLLFVFLLVGDYHLRDKNVPEHNVYNFQIYLQEPGVIVIPRGDEARVPEINLWEKGNTEEIAKFLEGYPNSANTTQHCKNTGVTRNCTVGKDIQILGACSPDVAGQNYGYELPYEPCVILKVNKIYGWIPKPYKTDNNVPLDHVQIKCNTLRLVDDQLYTGSFNESIFFPPSGFSLDCFPFCGKSQKYVQPFVMVKFRGLDSVKSTAVMCQLEAENIEDSQTTRGKMLDQIGSITFVLNPIKQK